MSRLLRKQIASRRNKTERERLENNHRILTMYKSRKPRVGPDLEVRIHTLKKEINSVVKQLREIAGNTTNWSPTMIRDTFQYVYVATGASIPNKGRPGWGYLEARTTKQRTGTYGYLQQYLKTCYERLAQWQEFEKVSKPEKPGLLKRMLGNG